MGKSNPSPPAAPDYTGAAQAQGAALRAAGFRVDVIEANDQLGKRIRAAKLDKIPYVLVVGDDDVAEKTFGVNPRGGVVERGVSVATFIERLAADVEQGSAGLTPVV